MLPKGEENKLSLFIPSRQKNAVLRELLLQDGEESNQSMYPRRGRKGKEEKAYNTEDIFSTILLFKNTSRNKPFYF